MDDNKQQPLTDELMAMLSEQATQQQCKNLTKANYIYTFFVFFVWVCIAVLLGFFVNVKCGWMFAGFWSLAMYLNITITTLSNITLGREVDGTKDTGWKSIFGFGAAVCLAVACSI